jgi:carbon storage regulator
MLVITRKEDQTIRIGDAIVSVVRTRSGKVTLGIDAPANIKILRGELEERNAAPPRDRGEAA